MAALALLLLLAAAGTAPPATAAQGRDRLIVGLNAFRDGFYDLAVKELRAYLRESPESPRRAELLDLVFRAEVARGNPDGARDVLEELAGLGGRPGREALYWLGWLEVRQGRPAAALDPLERYLASGGGEHRAEARYLAGLAALEAGKPDRAADHFGTYLEEYAAGERRVAAWEGRIRALEELGRVPEAVRVVREALEDPVVGRDPAATERLARLGVRLATSAEDRARFWGIVAERAGRVADRLEARFREGAAWAEAERPAEASRALAAYLKEQPEGPRAAEAHLLLADLERRQGRFEKALAHLEAALRRPDAAAVRARATQLRRAAFALALKVHDEERAAVHAERLLAEEAPLSPAERARAHLVLARRAARAGREEEALAHWEAAARDEGALFRTARMEAARWLLEKGRPVEALDWLSPLLGNQPDADAVRLALVAAERAGDPGTAARLSLRAARAEPDPARKAQLLTRAARHLRQAGDRAQYRRVLATLASPPLAATREGSWAAAELQRLAFEAGRWEEVLRWSEPARRADRDGAVAFRQAEALARLDRVEEAARIWERLSQKAGPWQGAALVRLGTLADQAGRLDRARVLYERAVRAGVPDETARWVRERLAALEPERDGSQP